MANEELINFDWVTEKIMASVITANVKAEYSMEDLQLPRNPSGSS